jgi:DNA polymerase III subunit delta'
MDTMITTPTLNEWNLLGNDWAVTLLHEQLASNNARHAYLLTGPGGIGRRTLALRFIQGMNCPNIPSAGQPCMLDTCRTCRQIMDMQHPDLRVVRVPEGKSEILIDQIRELQSFLMLAPYESPFKVGLLLNFERATVQAQNALLKTLEEAPERARLLITADSAESLLPTIASRCESLRLRPLPIGETARALIAWQGLDPARAELIDHLAAGRYGYALHMLEDEAFLQQRADVLNELIAVLNKNIRSRFKMVEDLLPRKGEPSKQRKIARDTLLIWQSFFRDVLICQSGASTPLMNLDLQDSIFRIAAARDVSQSETMINACDVALERIDRYCNVRLVLESMVMEFD